MGLLFTGLDRSAFDNKTVSFEEHCTKEHNMWHYLYFIVLVKVKDPTEFTGPESYVHAMIKVGNTSVWLLHNYCSVIQYNTCNVVTFGTVEI